MSFRNISFLDAGPNLSQNRVLPKTSERLVDWLVLANERQNQPSTDQQPPTAPTQHTPTPNTSFDLILLRVID
jgi:hypothetical protein